jgi:hypothetical protein
MKLESCSCFCPPLRSRGGVTAGDGVVAHNAVVDPVVTDPRRFLTLKPAPSGLGRCAATPYSAGGDL